MSLSKYYKNSNSFQPETLIKRNEASTGWQPLPAAAETRFQAHELPKVSIVAETEDPRQPPPASAKAKDPVEASAEPAASLNEPAETAIDETKIAPPAPRQEIDLSKYLELAIVEKQIEEAYQKGLQAGGEKAEEDFGAASRALLTTCQQLDNVRETIIANSRDELLDFALAISEKVLRFSVREQDVTIVATIEEALQRAVKSDEFTVYIHPDDYETVSAKSTELVNGLSGLNKIVLKNDTTIQRGGAKIESDNCTVDATITGQLEVIREEIKKNL